MDLLRGARAARLLVAALALMIAGGVCSAAGIYSLDDGTLDGSMSLTGGPLVWLNQFTAQPGMQTIHRLGVVWPRGVPVGDHAELAIWDDPNNDGNPSDATPLAIASVLTANVGTNTFNWVEIDPVTFPVGRSFFVGVGYSQLSPAAYDDVGVANGRSWLAGWLVFGYNIVDLSTADLPLATLDSYGYTANWMVRAEANDAIPEPLTLSLCTAGLAALACRNRLRRKRR